jgi:hypothetical protein
MNKKAVRIRSVSEADRDDDLKKLSPSDLIGMMWQLALNAWSFRISINVEPRLQRDVVVLTRGKG